MGAFLVNLSLHPSVGAMLAEGAVYGEVLAELVIETLVVSSHFVVGAELVPKTKLIIEGVLRLQDGSEVPVSALIDTGAEISLIRKGLVDGKYFHQSSRPKKFLTANEGVLDGGLEEVPCDVVMWGKCCATNENFGVMCPCSLYDANINVDVILSYEWLGKMKMDVCCHRHGLEVQLEGGPVWVSGIAFSSK